MASKDTDRLALFNALKQYYKTDDICFGKGGFFIRDIGFKTIAQARKLTGLKSNCTRQVNNTIINNDYNWLCRIAGKV